MSIEGQGHFLTIYFPDFVCTRPRYQVSVYRTIGPLVVVKFGKNEAESQAVFAVSYVRDVRGCAMLPDSTVIPISTALIFY